MGSAEEPDAELVMLSRKLLRGTSDPLGVAKLIKVVKAVNSGGSFGDKELYNALLCSDSPKHHAEALEVARRNIDQFWGRLWLSKMYFNGVGTDRDVMAAFHTLYSDNPIIKHKSGAEL